VADHEHAGAARLSPDAHSDEIDGLMAFYANGRKKGSFDTGIQMALRRMLASPSSYCGPSATGARRAVRIR
jgi:hypothetical protein